MLASCGPAAPGCGKLLPSFVPGALAALQAVTDPTDSISVSASGYAPLAFNGGVQRFGTSIRIVSPSQFQLADPGTYLVQFTVPLQQNDSTQSTFAKLGQQGSQFLAAVTFNSAYGTLSGGALVASDGTDTVTLDLNTTGTGGNESVIPLDSQAILTITQLSRTVLS